MILILNIFSYFFLQRLFQILIYQNHYMFLPSFDHRLTSKINLFHFLIEFKKNYKEYVKSIEVLPKIILKYVKKELSIDYRILVNHQINN